MAGRSGHLQGSEARRSAHHGLDWLNLYVANIQTGFGAFIAVYLTTRHWTQADIGIALSIGTITTMASQIPAGAVVDAFRSKVLVAGLSMAAFAVAALVFAMWPVQLYVYLAEILHGFSSATLAPAIAAISLGLVGTSGMAWRLSRNTRFSALGNGIGALIMGVIGSLVSARSVFFLTAILTLPAFLALRPLRAKRLDQLEGEADENPVQTPTQESTQTPTQTIEPPAAATVPVSVWKVVSNPWLLVLCLCVLTFTFANAPMVPSAASEMTKHVGRLASVLTGVIIVLPQVIVLFSSTWVGHLADRFGRKPLLVIGCCTLPLHGLALAMSANPWVVVGSEVFDGIGAVCFGILIPLITSDLAGDSGHYNLALGIVGFAMGIGASIAMPAAGKIIDQFGYSTGFAVLAGAGVVAIIVALMMRETRPEDVSAEPAFISE